MAEALAREAQSNGSRTRLARLARPAIVWLVLSTGAVGDAVTQDVAADAPPGETIEILDSGRVLPPGLPFAEAVRVGDLLFLSGQIGIRPGTLELVPGGFAAEARQTMENIRSSLAAHGYAMKDVVKCTVMLVDIERWPEFNEIYTLYFDGHRPARSAFAGTGLALGAEVEVECVAAGRGGATASEGQD